MESPNPSNESPTPSDAPLQAAPVETPAEKPRRMKAKARRRRMVWIALLIGVLAGGMIGARPAWRAFKRWRADRMAEQGRAFMTAGNPEAALDQARKALQIASGSRKALRLALDSSEAARSPLVLGFASRLAQTPTASTADIQDAVRIALQFEQTKLASNLLGRLSLDLSPSPVSVRLAAQLAVLQRNLPAALRHWRNAHRIEPENPTNLLGLATALVVARNPAQFDEARRLLWTVVRSETNAVRQSALELLVRPPLGNTNEYRAVVQSLGSQASRNLRETLVLAEAMVGLSTNGVREANVLVSSWSEPLDADGTLRVASFFGRHVSPLIPPRFLTFTMAATNAAIYRARLMALVDAGERDLAYRESLEPPKALRLDPLELEFARYRIARSLTNQTLISEHSSRLVSAAGREPARLRRLALFAEEERLWEVLDETGEALARVPGETTEALIYQLRAADRQGDTAGARVAARRLAALAPDDVASGLRVAYLDALLGENLPAAVTTATNLFAKPEFAIHARATAALAYLRLGQATNAAKCLLVQVPSGVVIAPSYQAISVAVNASLGRAAVAGLIARSLPFAALRPEERDLVRPLLPPPTPLLVPAPNSNAVPATLPAAPENP